MNLFRLLVGCVMSKVLFKGLKRPTVLRLVIAGLGASLLTGCADSGRFGESGDPLGNPFKTSSRVDRNATGSIESAPPMASSGPIQSRPLSSPVSSPMSSPVPQRPVANYSAPAHPSPQFASTTAAGHYETTGSVGRPAQGVAGWSANGGTPIVVANGETADTIASRYGIPRDALVRTNGFNSAAEIKPGTRVIIPVYNASLAASSGAPAHHEEPVKFVKGPEPAAHSVKTRVAERDVKSSGKDIGKDISKPGKEAAKESKIAQKPSKDMLKSAKEEHPSSKGKEQVAMKQTPAPAVVKEAPTKTAMKDVSSKKEHEAAKAESIKTAKAEVNAPEARKSVDNMPIASLPSEKATQGAASETANPEFRWPAHGRVIQGFKAGGNDGINIAVPEGTAVKAAESGVVAYAGSELKGYGNLVLIRHPNGFVSAYANNGDIEVKRGDSVKRGQTIAKSGQSGNVASPQLHFELRKGSTPVDPTQFLAGL
jgi:murein DD-endopeptidase MepM/ murein hydrolase activator NlpD